jgi:phage shock protein A
MEDKINQLEAKADAEAELNKHLEGTDIENQFKQLEADDKIKSKLAALKEKVEQKQIEGSADEKK